MTVGVATFSEPSSASLSHVYHWLKPLRARFDVMKLVVKLHGTFAFASFLLFLLGLDLMTTQPRVLRKSKICEILSAFSLSCSCVPYVFRLPVQYEYSTCNRVHFPLLE